MMNQNCANALNFEALNTGNGARFLAYAMCVTGYTQRSYCCTEINLKPGEFWAIFW